MAGSDQGSFIANIRNISTCFGEGETVNQGPRAGCHRDSAALEPKLKQVKGVKENRTCSVTAAFGQFFGSMIS